jgi:hypothetical protein
LRVPLAGLSFEIGPEELLSEEELAGLERIRGAPLLRGGRDEVLGEPLAVRLGSAPPWEGPEGIAPPGGPGEVTCVGDRVRVGGESLRAEIRPFESTAEVYRRGPGGQCVEMAMRIFAASAAPLHGALPIHAAGIAFDAGGAVFYGVSGAGKSTLSAQAPAPVLSDEAVVVARHRDEWTVASGGFWGTFQGGEAPRGFLPLRALFELRKGAGTRVERLSARDALLSLLPVITIPDNAKLWSAALNLVGSLAQSVPVFRLHWAPAVPPWPEIEAAL